MAVAAGQDVTVTEAHVGGHGPPLVLLHGINASWRIWTPVLAGLEQHFTVHALTLPGHRGGPSWDDPSVDARRLALATVDRLTAKGLKRPHIVGNSLGGWVALELAQLGAVRSVTAFSPGGAWRQPGDLARQVRSFRMLRAVVRHSSFRRLLTKRKLRRLVFWGMAAHPGRIPQDAVEDLVADVAACTLADRFVETLAARPEACTSFQASASCPVRIVWPFADRTVPFDRFGQPLVERLPGVTLLRLDGVGHMPMWDDPQAVVATIVDSAGVAR